MDATSPVTPHSIHEARIAQWRERRELERLTGLRIREDGTILHPRKVQR